MLLHRFLRHQSVPLPAVAVGDVLLVVNAVVEGWRLSRGRRVLAASAHVASTSFVHWPGGAPAGGPGGNASDGGGGPLPPAEVFGRRSPRLGAADEAAVRRLRVWSAAFVGRHAFPDASSVVPLGAGGGWRGVGQAAVSVGRVLRVRSTEPLVVEVWAGWGAPPPPPHAPPAVGAPPPPARGSCWWRRPPGRRLAPPPGH